MRDIRFVAVDNSGPISPGCKTVTVPNQTKVDIGTPGSRPSNSYKSILQDEKGHVLAFRRVELFLDVFDGRIERVLL